MVVRITNCVLCIFCCIILVSCGNKNVSAVEEKIEAIGVVTLESMDVIDEAEYLYNTLTDKEKSEVSNYSLLQEAKSDYQHCVEDAFVGKCRQGDFKEAYDIISGLTQEWIETLQPEITQCLYDFLLNMSTEDTTYLTAPEVGSDVTIWREIIGLGNNVASMDFSEADSVLLEIQEFYQKHGQYNEFINYHSYVSDQGAWESIINKLDMALRYGSIKMLQISLEELDSLVDEIDYNGTDEMALDYVRALENLRDGVEKIMSGVVVSDSALFDEGKEQVANGIKSTVSYDEVAVGLMEECVSVLEDIKNYCDSINQAR